MTPPRRRGTIVAMSFQVEKLNRTECRACGASVDLAQAKVLSTIACPNCGADVTVCAKVGSMLITRLLGVGTGSVVYEAEDRVLGRKVALKVMKILDDSEVGKQSGLDEARSLLLINHPHIVKVFAIESRYGQPCIIMELLPNGSLKDLIAGGQNVDEALALSIIAGIADALKITSDRGLLHLDVKPGNVMFDVEGVAKLCDFGYAAIDPDDDLNEILGTPYYVSPELVRQLPPDLRADIYSLGATLFHILTGVPPFESDDDDIKRILLMRLNQPAPNVRSIPLDPPLHDKTAHVVARMLEEDPDDRYRNYDDLIADLEAARLAVEQRDAMLT